jgi:RHS repeat-associated protein
VTHRFTGHDLDPATGLYFAPFRYYYPTGARWMTRDPLGMVDGPNVYAYAGGHPINRIDPLGRSMWWNPYCWFGLNDCSDDWKKPAGKRPKPPGGYKPFTPHVEISESEFLTIKGIEEYLREHGHRAAGTTVGIGTELAVHAPGAAAGMGSLIKRNCHVRDFFFDENTPLEGEAGYEGEDMLNSRSH